MKDVNKKLNLDITANGKSIDNLVKTLALLDKDIDSQRKKRSKDLTETLAMHDKISAGIKRAVNEELKAARWRNQAEQEYLNIVKSTSEFQRRERKEAAAERNAMRAYWLSQNKSMAEANRLSTQGMKPLIDEKVRGDKELEFYNKAMDPSTYKKGFSAREFVSEQFNKAVSRRTTALRERDAQLKLLQSPDISDSERAVAKKAMQAAGKTATEAGEQAAALGKVGTGLTIAQAFVDAAKKVASVFNGMLKTTLGVSLSLKDNFRDILGSVRESVDLYKGMATYSIGTSLVANAQAREMMMRYGLSASQTYGFAQARELLGLTSEEDLMYMNPRQQAALSEYMERFSSWYSQLEESGVLEEIQQMQLDFAMFKQEMSVEFLQWVGKNKEEIFTVIKGGFEILKWIFNAISKVANFLMPGSISTSSDFANAKVTNSGGKNITVQMYANSTGVLSSQEAMEEFFAEQMEHLAGEISVELGE